MEPHDARAPRRAARPRRRPAARPRSTSSCPLVQAETGATLRVAQTMQVPTCVERLRRYARGALEPTDDPAAAERDAVDRAGAGRAHGRDRRAPAGRRRRLHHAVQLPDREHGRQGRPGPRHGQHRRREAGAAGPAGGHGLRRDARRGRLPAGRRQRRDRQRRRRRRGARRLAARRHGVVHRLDRGRPAHRRGRAAGA